MRVSSSSVSASKRSTSTGVVDDLDPSNQGCLSAGERQGTWYYFSPQPSGSIAFSMVMVRVAPGEDIKSVAEAMKSGINPRKWVCVEADDMLVTGYRDVVMLIMLDTSYDLTAQSFVDAFGKVVGGARVEGDQIHRHTADERQVARLPRRARHRHRSGHRILCIFRG